jgi:hypothetical protein
MVRIGMHGEVGYGGWPLTRSREHGTVVAAGAFRGRAAEIDVA